MLKTLRRMFFIFCLFNIVFLQVILASQIEEIETEKKYKISFHVLDSYGNNLDGIAFKIFEDKEEALKNIEKVVSNKEIDLSNSLISKNGVVVSDLFYNIDKEYHIIQLTNSEEYIYKDTIYTFRLANNDNFATQKVEGADGMVSFIKEIMPTPLEVKNKYLMKLIKSDSYNNKLGGVVFKIYSDIENAKKALQENIDIGYIKNIEGLIETFDETNTAGIATSKKFYEPRKYYLVELHRDAYERYQTITKPIEISILEAEKGELIDRELFDGDKLYYRKIIEPKKLISKNKYKIKVKNISSSTNQDVKVYDSKDNAESRTEEGLLERISVQTNNIAIGRKFFSNGKYFLSFKKNNEFRVKELLIEDADIMEIEQETFEKDKYNPYCFVKTITVDKTEITHLNNENIPIPLSKPKEKPIIRTNSFSVYDDTSYNCYMVFDENNLPLGYIKKSDKIDIVNYDILGNLSNFSQKRVNPQTYDNLFLNAFWVLVAFCSYLAIFYFFRHNKKRY